MAKKIGEIKAVLKKLNFIDLVNDNQKRND